MPTSGAQNLHPAGMLLRKKLFLAHHFPSVAAEEGGGDTGARAQGAGECAVVDEVDAARGAAFFQDDEFRADKLGEAQGLAGAAKEVLGDVRAVAGKDAGAALQNVVACAADDLRRWPWRGQSAQLLGAHGNGAMAAHQFRENVAPVRAAAPRDFATDEARRYEIHFPSRARILEDELG